MLSVQSGLQALPTPHLYLQDPQTGLWWNPDATLPSSPVEVPLNSDADYALAESLWRNVAKQNPCRLLDRGPCVTSRLEPAWIKITHAMPRTPKLDSVLAVYVHTFQHLPYGDAVKELENLAALEPEKELKVFIRIPDREVPGFERDLTPDIIRRNACFYTLHGMLELLYRNGRFVVDETYPLAPGQRDWILRRVPRRPTVAVGMIAKNEERDLPVLLDSLKNLNLDGFCLIDTGSTDKTLAVAQTAPAREVWTDVYLGASQTDENGDWKLWDFSKARNQYVEQIETKGYDWVLWMDADDQVLHPDHLRRLSIWTQYDIHGIQMDGGGPRWPHHRLWKTRKGIRYQGRCHEYPYSGNAPGLIHQDIVIRHNAAPGTGEGSNARNRRILELEMKEAPSTRCAFYLGQTYHHGGMPKEAVEAYTTRIQMGFGYEDEYWFAHLYRARCALEAHGPESALRYVREALVGRPDWAELWMLAAGAEMKLGHYWKAIGLALQAKDMPIPPTNLWRERDKYTDQPYRVISWCYEHLGMWEPALQWALQARPKIGVLDKDWEQRIERIEGELKEKGEKLIRRSGPRGVHVWHRPGALGDVLMTLNLVQMFHEEHRPEKLIYRCAAGTKALLEPILLEAGFDAVQTTDDPQEAHARVWNLVGYPLHEGYPELPMRKHLIEYFADELQLTLGNSLPRAHFDLPPVVSMLPYCTLHPKAGWSPYKNWPLDRWAQVVKELRRHKIPVLQLGAADDPKVPGTTSVQDATFEEQFAILGGARLHLGVDSWSNHARFFQFSAAGELLPDRQTLILWGSTQISAAGYGTAHNMGLDLSCRPCFREDPRISRMSRGPCPHLSDGQHPCMGGISALAVAQKALELWNAP
jgi:tetratricopeptide (TPR) repeat protein